MMEFETAARMTTQVIAGQLEAATGAAGGELTAAKKYAHKRIFDRLRRAKREMQRTKRRINLAFLVKTAGNCPILKADRERGEVAEAKRNGDSARLQRCTVP
jgi:hypothetical protein